MSIWVCNECARKHECQMPEGHIATFHIGACDVCGKEGMEVTEDRDYGQHRHKLIRAQQERINQVVMPTAKKTTKKKPVVKKGLFMRKSLKGVSVHIHFGNGHKACAMTGYNNAANMQKGLLALNRTLNEAYDDVTGKFNVVDERPKAPKKVAKKA